MRRRILLAIVGVTLLATVVLTIPLGVIIGYREKDDSFRELDRIAERTAAGLTPNVKTPDSPPEVPKVERSVHVAVYDRSGVRLAGTGPARADRAAQVRGPLTRNTQTSSERIVARPVVIGGQRLGVIRVAESVAESVARVRHDLLVLALIDLVALLIAAAIGWVVAARLVRPLRRIRDDAVRLGHGDFSIHPPPSGVAELDETAAALAETATRLDESLRREREFSSNASHQLRTPITAMRVALESEVLTPRADPTEVLLESITELDRLELTINTLLAVARDRPQRRVAVDIGTVVAGVRSRWSSDLAARGRSLGVVTPPDAAANVNAAILDQILDVLVGNAAAHGLGDVTLTIDDTDGTLAVCVRDEGSIGEDRTDLFVRGDPGAAGHGVGLALARALAEAEGGRLALASASPTEFRLVLPDAPSAS